MKYRTEFVIAKCTLTRRAYYWQMNNSHPPMEVKQCKQSGAELQRGYRMQAAADRASFCIQWGLEHPKTQVNQRKMFAVNAIAIFLSRLLSPASCLLFFYPHCSANLHCFLLHSTKSVCNMRSKQIQKYSVSAHWAAAQADQANPSRYPNMAIHRLRFPHMQI